MCDALGVGRRLHRLHRRRDDATEVERLQSQPDLARDRARHVQEVVDDLCLRLRVPLDDFRRPLALVVSKFAGDEHACPAVDRRQGRAQFVRHRHQELVLHAVGELLAFEQLRAFLHVAAQFELTAASPERDRDGSGEDKPANRSLENHDVAQWAEHSQWPYARQRELTSSHDDDRDIRPSRLRIQCLHEHRQSRRGEGLLRNQEHTGALRRRGAELLDGVAPFRGNALRFQHLAGNLRVVPCRCEHDHPFGLSVHGRRLDTAVSARCIRARP